MKGEKPNQPGPSRAPAGETDAIDPSQLLARFEQMQADLSNLQRQVEESSHLSMLGLLAASMAHELRNILTPVLGYAQLARARRGDGALLEKALERIITGLRSASDILDTAFEGAAQQQPAPAERGAHEAGVDEALREVVALLPRHPAHDHIEMVVDIERNARVAMRPIALRQVLLNLMLNAVEAMRHMPSDRVRRLTIRARRNQAPAGLTIEISDTGCGIPPEVAPRVFEPFGAVGCGQAGLSPAQDGRPPLPLRPRSGLGLSICKRLVESAGGSIALVQGEEGLARRTPPQQTGATFRLHLPTPAPAQLRKAG